MPNTAFPHVTQSTAAVQRYEPVVGSNFNAYFVTGSNLRQHLTDNGVGIETILPEYIKKIDGLFLEKAGNTLESGYKTTKFKYDSNEKDNTFTLTIDFFNFLDNDSKQFVYNILAEWSRVKYNPMTGEKSLKDVYADCQLVVEKFNRDGTVYWRRVAHHIFPSGDFTEQSVDYSANDQNELSLEFDVTWVSDITNDPRLAAAQ